MQDLLHKNTQIVRKRQKNDISILPITQSTKKVRITSRQEELIKEMQKQQAKIMQVNGT